MEFRRRGRRCAACCATSRRMPLLAARQAGKQCRQWRPARRALLLRSSGTPPWQGL